jgi:hypothetical protein
MKVPQTQDSGPGRRAQASKLSGSLPRRKLKSRAGPAPAAPAPELPVLHEADPAELYAEFNGGWGCDECGAPRSPAPLALNMFR